MNKNNLLDNIRSLEGFTSDLTCNFFLLEMYNDLLESRLDGSIGFHGADEHVEDPEEDKDC